MSHKNQIIACVIRQYGSGSFKSCVSMEKDNTICLGTHHDEKSANDLIERFWEALKTGLIKSPEDAMTLINAPA